ncbi:MAG: hypothetical protein O3A63_14500 [Proteobacteria bacterium]|nr:hypothetical protein [Pseudomonadota bacterium]
MNKLVNGLLLLLVSTCVWCDPVDEIIETAGITRSLDSIESQLLRGFRAGLAQTPADSATREEMMQELQAQFAPGIFQAHVHRKISATLLEPDHAELMAWYSAPLGKKITSYEIAAIEPEQISKMTAMVDRLVADEARMRIAARMDELLDSTDQNIELARASQTAILEGMLGKEDAARFMLQMDEALDQNRAEMERLVHASMVFIYQDLTRDELEQYIGFLANPSAQRLYQAAQVGLIEYVALSFEQVGSLLRRKLEMPVTGLQEHAVVHHR